MELHLLKQEWSVGASLGTVPQVQESLGLGRPSCREAMTILETRGILDIRCGPGGGLFVSAPELADVVDSTMLLLAVNGDTSECIRDFRLVVWRMILDAVRNAPGGAKQRADQMSHWGFACNFAEAIGNPVIIVAARFAEMLVCACGGAAAPSVDRDLETAVKKGLWKLAANRLNQLAHTSELIEPLAALRSIEKDRTYGARKSAMILAAQMTSEFIHNQGVVESESETSLRLGYTDPIVRQARRVLQDMGLIRCRRGSKGAVFEAPAKLAGTIRLLAACLARTRPTPEENGSVACFLACRASVLAAQRVKTGGWVPVKQAIPEMNGLDHADLMKVENLLLDLSGNPVLAIFVRALALSDTCLVPRQMTSEVHARVAELSRKVLHSIEAGDAATAYRYAKLKGQMLAAAIERLRRQV
jgi:DNA-binding FadR family transcriptional regulator